MLTFARPSHVHKHIFSQRGVGMIISSVTTTANDLSKIALPQITYPRKAGKLSWTQSGVRASSLPRGQGWLPPCPHRGSIFNLFCWRALSQVAGPGRCSPCVPFSVACFFHRDMIVHRVRFPFGGAIDFASTRATYKPNRKKKIKP